MSKPTITLNAVIGLVAALLLSACARSGSQPGQEMGQVPGAYTFSEGHTAYPDLYQQAIDHFQKSEYDLAEAIYLDLIEKEPENSNGYVGLGSSLLLQDRADEAKDAYAAALRISPESIESLVGLGSTNYLLEEYDQAADYYARALALEPQNPNAHWGLALTLDILGQRQAALEHLQRVLELSPGSGMAADAANMIAELRSQPEK